MAYLLHIETASTNCSVAISENNQLLACTEKNDGYTHAENLHLFIKECLKKAGITPKQLNAVCVSGGPGSYTGLRIGVSAAKGLCYALNVPLIHIETLMNLSALAQQKINEKEYYLFPMLDARRMEVYCACYNQDLATINTTNAWIVDETSAVNLRFDKPVYFFGDGMPKCKELIKSIPNAEFIEGLIPSASSMCDIGFEKFENNKFEDTAYFEPNYLKEFMIKKKSV